MVTREDGAWLADVPELGGARTLPALDRAVREVVVLVVDRLDEDMPALRLVYDYRIGDPGCQMNTYEVTATRDGRCWMILIPAIDGLTRAHHLDTAEEMARSLITATADVPPDSFTMTIRPA